MRGFGKTEGEQLPLGGQTAIVAAAAHELKNPLTLITYIAQTINDKTLDITEQERDEQLSRLLLVSQRALRLVQHLTVSYRLETDRQLAFAFPLEPVNIREVCETALHELTPYAREYNQTLRLHAPHCSHNAIANRDIAYDIVVNLVDNAIRHNTPGASVDVTPVCRADLVRLNVHDSGTTIHATELARLRRSLGREPQPLSAHGGTSGLGLYIATQLAEAMGGGLGLGRPGQGTTFFVNLMRSRQLSLW